MTKLIPAKFTRQCPIPVLLFLNMLFCAVSCNNDPPVIDPTKQLLINTEEIINADFMGNGVQWGGYELLENWTGDDDFSESDWQKMKKRIDYMQPSFMRIMIDANWNYISQDQYDSTKASAAFHRILQYCTDNDITVMFGEWGHKYINNDISQVNEDWLKWAADYLDWLVNEKNYSCIRYYNLVNEPNGSWSSTMGNYYVWRDLVIDFYDELLERGLETQVKLAGPDIVVWDADHTDWISNTKNDLGDIIALYDIHSYPGQNQVRGGDFLEMLEVCKDAAPTGQQIVLGEIGFKYGQDDIDLKEENKERIANTPNTSDDSNMFTYDGFYGIDMADALVSSMMAGYGGSLIWDLDDAMYNLPDETYNVKELKRWGFWNILGEELASDTEDEETRPFFYPVSLICRYFPGGSKIFNVSIPEKKGLRMIAGQKDGYYTIVLVNSHYASYEDLVLTASSLPVLENIKEYIYHSELDGSFTGLTDDDGFPVPENEGISLDLKEGTVVNLRGQSVIVYTNFPY